MAEKLNYKQLATDIVGLVGGAENVISLGHCMTRLRFVLKDEARANPEKIKTLKSVLGVVVSGGQFMVILGQNLLPVYEAAIKEFHLNEGAASNENLDKKKEPLTVKNALLSVLGFVSGSVAPMLPGLVAGGMLKVVLLLITQISAGFAATSTYTILSGLADAAFYFMPIFIAYGAASKLGGTPIFSMIAAAALLHGKYTALVAAGEAVTLVGLPVRLASYSGSMLPALLIAVLAVYLEKWFNKIIPGIFKSLLVGLCTVTVASIAGFVVLAPLGGFVGEYLANVFVFLGDKVGFIAVAALAACLPWMVMCGMHTALVPFMTQALVDPGYDSIFRPAFILHNMAEGGACIGVALRTKSAQLRSEALGIAFGCIVAGVTEPAVYGINLPRKKPMIGVMAGGAAGGIVCALLGARVYVMGYSTILALPIFQDTILAAAVAVVAAIAVAAVVTFVLGFDEEQSAPAESAIPAAADNVLVAVTDGSMIDITTVSDKTFADKILGDGVAFQPKTGVIVSPCNGVLSTLADTGHAFGVSRPDGVEALVHVGINTVEMQGTGFTALAKEGETVRAGQPILRVDLELLKGKGYDMTTMLILTDDNGKVIHFRSYGPVKQGEAVTV
ncbi:MAG: glucose PTS transporter subunit IIA [Faecalibacterium sp.]